jgi:hypothetical protein
MTPRAGAQRPRAALNYQCAAVGPKSQETPGAPEDARGIKRDTRTRGTGGRAGDPKDTGRTGGHSGGIGRDTKRTGGNNGIVGAGRKAGKTRQHTCALCSACRIMLLPLQAV